MHSAATKFGGFSALQSSRPPLSARSIAVVLKVSGAAFGVFFVAIKSLRSISANVAVISQMNPGPGVDTF